MANLYNTRRTPTSIAVTSASGAYVGNNLFSDSISRPWYATGVTQQDIDFTYGAGVTVQAVSVHDVNFGSAEIWVKVGAGAIAKVGDMTCYRDKHGRYRGRYVVGGTANVTQIRVRVLNGAANDGLTYYRIGAMGVWGAVAALPPGPLWGYDPKLVRPRTRAALPNGQAAVAATGKEFMLIQMRMQPYASESWNAFFDALRLGTCLMDMNLSAKGWEVWPVIWEDDGMSNPQSSPSSDDFQLVLREVVA